MRGVYTVNQENLLEVLGSQTAIPEGSERKWKFRREGFNDYGIQRAWGVEHFGISEGKGMGGKY